MNVAGLEIKIEKSAIYAFAVMVIVFAIITGAVRLATGNSQGTSLWGVLGVALAAAAFHFVAQFFHMLGHAIAARATGHPKRGMVFMYVIAMSLYPEDEPELPGRVHIQRALGGVIAFALILLVTVLLWASTRDAAQWTTRYLTTFLLVDASLLFAVSALISDGVLFVARKEWLEPLSKPSK